MSKGKKEIKSISSDDDGFWVDSDFLAEHFGLVLSAMEDAGNTGEIRVRTDCDRTLYALADVDGWVRRQPNSGPRVISDMVTSAAMKKRLQRVNLLAQMGTMAMSVGHDINNPLTYVLSNAEYIRKEILPQLRKRAAGTSTSTEILEELEELISETEQGAEHIRQVVGQLSAMSRPAVNAKNQVSLSDVVASAIRMAGPALNSSVTLTKHTSAQRTLCVDAAALTQVLINLITNAVHGVQGMVDPKVEVICTEDSDWALIEVRDNGAGIRHELLERIFDPFFTTKPVGEGTGLGLSVCRRLVRDMDGTLTLSSKVGEGTTVTLQLPLGDSPAEAETMALSFADIAGCRLLVVEDDPAVLRSVERILVSSGIEFTLENSPHRALARIATTKFDLVLCDLMMPSMTGMALYREVMNREPALCSRFVFMSGGPSSEEARVFSAAHSERLLAKPINVEALVEALVTRHQDDGERLEPCPNIARCPMFPEFESKRMLGVYKVTYCEPTDGTYRRCARYRTMMTGVRPSPRLLPHGEELPDNA